MKNVDRLYAAAKKFPHEPGDKRNEALAFKLSLPGFGSVGEIKEFIECVAQGIALGFFTGREGTQLLYAAQVALGAVGREKGGKK